MVNGTRAPGTDQRPSLGALVADIATEVSQLVRGEIELAKAEMKESAKAGSTGGALLAVAGLLIAMVGLLTTWAAVYGLSETGLPLWSCYLIVAGVYLLVAVGLGFLGVRSLKRAKGPEQAVAELQRTKEIVSAIPPNSPPASRTTSKSTNTK
ncbi:MAG TPA: phage holin family protein [Actinomycetes bacterium]|nr:phage holin family protein [Actinomycetes bacterium]